MVASGRASVCHPLWPLGFIYEQKLDSLCKRLYFGLYVLYSWP